MDSKSTTVIVLVGLVVVAFLVMSKTNAALVRTSSGGSTASTINAGANLINAGVNAYSTVTDSGD
jgi:hypothetical protein